MRNPLVVTRLRTWLAAIGLGASWHAASAQSVTMPLPVQGLPAQPRGALIVDGVPPIDPNLAGQLADYLVGRDASFLAWLPDDSLLISTRFADVPAGTPGQCAAGDARTADLVSGPDHHRC